mmetsp:Transcript_67477/g.180286  ORF Transcript_67477/g.180286 Transcript_67477/m.180286 type:complete len:305 (+) Transcript_67477:163-1077(+)
MASRVPSSPVGREVVVDDERHLLHVDAAGEQVGGDEHARRARAELAHDELAPLLVHVAVKGRHGEVARSHLVEEEVHLPPGVDVDDGLGDGEGLVQVAEGLELPVLTLHRDVELLDTLERELVLLDQDAHGLAHEVLGDLQHLRGHRGREEPDLDLGRQKLEHVVDLVLETAREHLVGLVEDEDAHRVGAERATVDHVVHAARGAHHDLLARLQTADVVPDVGAANAGVALGLHVVAQGQHHLLDLLRQLARGREDERLALLEGGVHTLQAADREGRGLASARLSLGNGVATLDQGESAALLNS